MLLLFLFVVGGVVCGGGADAAVQTNVPYDQWVDKYPSSVLQIDAYCYTFVCLHYNF